MPDGKISEAKPFCQQLPISWTESTLQKAPVLITLHAFRPASYGTHSYSPSEIVILPYQIICLGLQDPCLQLSLGIGQPQTTCHFPTFLKLKGVLATLPHPQVRCRLLNFSPPQMNMSLVLGTTNSLQMDRSSAGLKESFAVCRIWLSLPYLISYRWAQIQNQIKRSAMFATWPFPSCQHIYETCFHAKMQCFCLFLFS